MSVEWINETLEKYAEANVGEDYFPSYEFIRLPDSASLGGSLGLKFDRSFRAVALGSRWRDQVEPAVSEFFFQSGHSPAVPSKKRNGIVAQFCRYLEGIVGEANVFAIETDSPSFDRMFAFERGRERWLLHFFIDV